MKIEFYFYAFLMFLLCIFLIITYEGEKTNLMILDGITLILCHNHLLNINKEKKEE